MRIAVDAMGGDHAPEEIVPGALAAAEVVAADICLVGDESRLSELLSQSGRASRSTDRPGEVSIHHADGVVEMDESPRAALQRGRSSSLASAVEMVRDGAAQAAVSAGNSGAFMALATMRLGNIAHIDRPAIALLLPTVAGLMVFLDAGANADCRPEHLLQFGMMGSCYAAVRGMPNPSVGILNIGEEASKGNAVTRAAYDLLQAAPLNFIGSVEGNSVFDGKVDVVVADGFVGNVLLKAMEGSFHMFRGLLKAGIAANWLSGVGAFLMKPAFAHLRQRCDWAAHGGALLLGVNGVCVVCHGRSNREAIKNAILQAATAVEQDITGRVRSSMLALAEPQPSAEVLSDT
ncbi:MAG TPA: phosphate acyltransferase PlsX [Armatimonadetes bacterium]|nr:phosphate acyltransferase PlsX [Armatimonadota bacterium]